MSLPSAVQRNLRFTTPTALETFAAFFVGNLFSNALCMGLIFVAFLRYAIGASAFEVFAVVAPLILVYYAYVFIEGAHETGWRHGSLGLFGTMLRESGNYFAPDVIVEEAPPGAAAPDARSQFIFACHPHGIHGYGTGALMNERSPVFERYPFLRGQLVGLAAWVLFFIPLVREVFLALGWRDAARATAQRVLAEGKSLYILVGGEAESLLSAPGTDVVVATGEKRLGYARLALMAGAPLIPVYCFNNTDTYATSTLGLSFRSWLSKRFQICVPLFHGRGFTPLPFNVKLTVAIGAPLALPERFRRAPAADSAAGAAARALVEPTDAEVRAYRAAHLEALAALFERHKARANYPTERVLEIRASE